MARATALLLLVTACSHDPAATPPPPPVSAPAPAPPSPSSSSSTLEQRFGPHCHLERTCGSLLGVDCNSASDGPYYYVRAGSLEVVSRCGGFCMGGRCTDCPPKEWTCPTY
jgi:hypothetical protein